MLVHGSVPGAARSFERLQNIDRGACVPKGIVAVAFLSQADLERLGDQFTRCFPVSEDMTFDDLLHAIDERDAMAGTTPAALSQNLE